MSKETIENNWSDSEGKLLDLEVEMQEMAEMGIAEIESYLGKVALFNETYPEKEKPS